MTLIADDRRSHVFPMALNDLTNAIASMNGLYTPINITSQPFKSQSLPSGFDGASFAGAMFLGFTYVLMCIGLSMDLIYDREVNSCTITW